MTSGLFLESQSMVTILYSPSRGPVIIDFLQVVDVLLNPLGMSFLERDCFNTCRSFSVRGLAVDSGSLFSSCVAEGFA